MDARDRLRASVLERFQRAADRFQWFVVIHVEKTVASPVPKPKKKLTSQHSSKAAKSTAESTRAFKKRREEAAITLMESLDERVFGRKLAGVKLEWSVTLNKTAGQTVA